MRQGIIRLNKRIADVAAFDVSVLVASGNPRLQALEKSIEATLSSVFGANTVEYNRYSEATSLDYLHFIFSG